MGKSHILQIVAVIILLLGSYMLFEHFANEPGKSSPLSGIGAIILGIALAAISKHKDIK